MVRDRNPLFQRIAAAGPGRVAVDGPAGTLTYGELRTRSAALAKLVASTTGPVGLYGHKEPAMLIGVLTALQLNRPYIPIDTIIPPERVASMCRLAQPGVIVAVSTLPPALDALLKMLRIPSLKIDALGEQLEEATGPEPLPASCYDPESPAYILFTSGTTGEPKGVPIPYRALVHFTSWLLNLRPFARDREVFLNQAPFNFDLSVMDLYGALLTGSTLFCLSRDEIVEPRALFTRLRGAPVTSWVSTPSFARFCLAEPTFRAELLPCLRCFLFCGETLPGSVAAALLERFPLAEVWNTYGPTETTVAVTAVQITREMAAYDQPLPVGYPAPGVAVWITPPGEPDRHLPAGESGEISIAGPQVALGYLSDDAASSAFVRGPFGQLIYRTGDLGHIDPPTGLLYCHGRLDRQIKLHGYRIELEEIEAQLRRVEGVAD
ncbi:MAG: AMP-binding protein, partial [Chloroflexi bacterium]|nr:AMP-binding protein [Chloroflexota bacterium]